jgi:hypothetical protein
LTGKLVHACAGLFKYAKIRADTLIKVARTMHEAEEPVAQVAAAEGVVFDVAASTAEVLSGAMEEAAQTVNNVSTKEQVIKQLHNAQQAVEVATELMQKLNALFVTVEQDLPYLAQKFDGIRKGFGEMVNKYIKMPYRHILMMELQIGRTARINLTGFHHDYGGIIENSGLVQFANKVIDKTGIYKADICLNGRWFRDKNVFSQGMVTRESYRKNY